MITCYGVALLRETWGRVQTSTRIIWNHRRPCSQTNCFSLGRTEEQTSFCHHGHAKVGLVFIYIHNFQWWSWCIQTKLFNIWWAHQSFGCRDCWGTGKGFHEIQGMNMFRFMVNPTVCQNKVSVHRLGLRVCGDHSQHQGLIKLP